ncbi:SusC/RagA family TonB-linked outer membrane protein [Parapedobacter koreensis]|uniref:TonB-linked outer membrane protein, SusC/RagA family n=1 Tax=Parapedobacter koreensis TaxID=332977 RepID=A0A1H7G7W9_9SPHI|nr:SusC/RagA family TonB-linked outer membrane protein [Parapedobacter koreensis]SEK34426.1 TonB-linked outer membrane protein, SusC/RagA family [Parapedobacter koreensis]
MENRILLLVGFLLTMAFTYGQQRAITGKVIGSADRQAIPSATVQVEGSNVATQTDDNGSFRLEVPQHATILISSVGYEVYRLTVGSATYYEVELNLESTGLDEVVVTALGISRERKSLGYAAQTIGGEDVSTVNTGNVTNALSGKVAGVQIRRNTNMGGSTNIVIRGYGSLTGNNQALFVVDGVPIDNSSPNTGDNSFDYGNMASDINPDDIASINVLKGAAATALYGSRAANGAVIITTKKGATAERASIRISSGVNFGSIDRSTFPKFQTKYGAGIGPVYGANGSSYFNEQDIDGDGTVDLVVPFTATASMGAPFDPDLLVFQWHAMDPESPKYMQKTPWVPAENGPITFFENPLTYTNNASLEGGSANGTYRLSYSNYLHSDLMPNSRLKRHNFSLNVSHKLLDKLTASGSANYINAQSKGRTEAGSGASFTNPLATFRNYWQTNIDVKEMGDMYFRTGRNVRPFYGGTTDNLYYVIYESFQSDERNRLFGNMSLKYEINDWLNIEGRVATDLYSYIQEDRRNNMTRVPARYTNYTSNFIETNYDLMLNFNKDLSTKFNLNGVLGTNIRRSKFQSVFNTTNNGLIVEKLFAISNSLNTPPPTEEVLRRIGVNGYFGLLSMGYNSMFYLDVTGRVDQSSTLPESNNTYFYPSIATSFIFSELMQSDVLSFGKFRLNYAKVGSDAQANSLVDVLTKPVPFGSVQLYTINDTKRNPELRPESTESWEAGIETSFLNNRLGLDVSLYKTNTRDQIMPVAVTSTTSYLSKFVNAGDVENKGIEVFLKGTPLKRERLQWDVNVNWALNRNKVISLFEGVESLQLRSFGAGVTLNAHVGRPYGTWYGTDYIYLDGQRVVNQTNGEYLRTTTTNNLIGNMNPSWNGGVLNKIRYKDFNLSFLVDVQKGGDIFSNDMANGLRDGVYDDWTVGLNDLGNPIRNSLADGGGIILPGVDENGNPNTVRTPINTTNHALGSNRAPQKYFIFDASYIKLREVSLSYRLPGGIFRSTPIESIDLSLIGSNLWIIHKNLPYADPEAGVGSGNAYGYQVGVYPTTRTIGFNIQVQF